jgi:hypothetical protein
VGGWALVCRDRWPRGGGAEIWQEVSTGAACTELPWGASQLVLATRATTTHPEPEARALSGCGLLEQAGSPNNSISACR